MVSIARGAVIDEPALIAALADGYLGGACLDVASVEPLPQESPLWDTQNVIISPHSASTVGGRPLRNLYSSEKGY